MLWRREIYVLVYSPFAPGYEPNTLTEVVERSLLSLLFIPLLALVFLLVWKVSWPLTPGTKLLTFLAYFIAEIYHFFLWNLWQPATAFHPLADALQTEFNSFVPLK